MTQPNVLIPKAQCDTNVDGEDHVAMQHKSSRDTPARNVVDTDTVLEVYAWGGAGKVKGCLAD